MFIREKLKDAASREERSGATSPADEGTCEEALPATADAQIPLF